MIDLTESDIANDFTKGSWDFPHMPDGPWPDDDPKWERFLALYKIQSLELFKQLPAYYLPARKKGLIKDPQSVVYRTLPKQNQLYVGALIQGGGKATMAFSEGAIVAEIRLSEPTTTDVEFPPNSVFRVLFISDDKVVMEQLQ